MIFLGIGSNLSSSFGSRFKNIEKAISYFKANQVEIIRQSSFYESYSYPNKNDPKFINIIISIKTSLTPEELMGLALSIEEKLERKRQKKMTQEHVILTLLILMEKYLILNLTRWIWLFHTKIFQQEILFYIH